MEKLKNLVNGLIQMANGEHMVMTPMLKKLLTLKLPVLPLVKSVMSHGLKHGKLKRHGYKSRIFTKH